MQTLLGQGKVLNFPWKGRNCQELPGRLKYALPEKENEGSGRAKGQSAEPLLHDPAPTYCFTLCRASLLAQKETPVLFQPAVLPRETDPNQHRAAARAGSERTKPKVPSQGWVLLSPMQAPASRQQIPKMPSREQELERMISTLLPTLDPWARALCSSPMRLAPGVIELNLNSTSCRRPWAGNRLPCEQQ